MALTSLLTRKAPNSRERGVGEAVRVYQNDERDLAIVVLEHAVQSITTDPKVVNFISELRRHRINLPTDKFGKIDIRVRYIQTDGLVEIVVGGVSGYVWRWSPANGEVELYADAERSVKPFLPRINLEDYRVY